jgi:hypothetical protein
VSVVSPPDIAAVVNVRLTMAVARRITGAGHSAKEYNGMQRPRLAAV